MNPATAEKVNKLKAIIKEMGSVLVAYSGGVDSTFLLKISLDVLGKDKVAAFNLSSQVYPKWETDEARCMAGEMGAKIIDVSQDILLIPAYKENPDDRCYHCKREMLAAAVSHAKAMGYKYVLEGTNADEAAAWRPGLKAVEESGSRSPLLEAGLTKDEIREASKELGLPTWDKPSMACLSSRFPHGESITPEKLDRIASCEFFLRENGIKQFRVRYHQDLARIEVAKTELGKIFRDGLSDAIVSHFKSAGFKFVTIDLEGYRTGSMNPDAALTKQS